MNIDRAAGALLVGLPIAFNLFFFLLGRAFDYPGILRGPGGTILNRFQEGWTDKRGPATRLTALPANG